MYFYIGFALLCFLLNFHFLRKRIMEYEIVASAIYLISFIFLQAFDVIFVLYLFFFVIPFIREIRYIKISLLITLVYIAAELVLGLFNDSFADVFAIFFTRFFLLIFLMLINAKKPVFTKGNIYYEQRLLRIVVFFDILIACILFLMNNSDFFVVAHQPVGANMSLVGVFLLLDISFLPENISLKYRKENFIYAVVFSIFVLISGIRGYIVVVIPCALLAVINYLFGQKHRILGLILCGFLAAIIMILCFIPNGVIGYLFSYIDISIGYRTLENEFFLKALQGANPLRWIFGYGIGAPGFIVGTEGLISSITTSYFYYSHIKEGSTLLNYWFAIVKDMGIIGLIIYVRFYLHIIQKKSRDIGKTRYLGFVFYLVLYAFMLMFRTSCTNGVIELFMVYMISNNPVFDVESSQFQKQNEFIRGERTGGNSGYF